MTGDSGNDALDGGSGTDTLELSGNGLTLGAARLGNFRSFESIDLRGLGANNIALDVAIVTQLSDSAALRIVADSDDNLYLNGGWSVGATVDDITTYTLDSSSLQIDSSAHLIINGVFALSALDGHNGSRFDAPSTAAGGRALVGLAIIGDVTNDGFDDFAIGTPGVGAGGVYVLFGRSGEFDATVALEDLPAGSGFHLAGVDTNDFAGAAISGAGDINGDGVADFIVGAPERAFGIGTSYVIFGRDDGAFASSLAFTDLAGSNGMRIDGVSTFDHIGRAISAAGDVNGDGYTDYVLGANEAPAYGVGFGASYVVFGDDDGVLPSIDLAALDGTEGFRIDAAADGDNAGSAVSAGDINGDGYSDLLIGAPYADGLGFEQAGVAYVVFGSATAGGDAIDLAALTPAQRFRIDGLGSNNNLGASLSASGDINGDGIADMVLSASNVASTTPAGGAVYVVFGSRTSFGAAFDLATLNGENGFRIENDAVDARVRVGAGADGGYGDLLLGVPYADSTAVNSGSTYLIYGRDFTGSVAQEGSSANDTLTGTSAPQNLLGGRGNDILTGGAGIDVLLGGSGDDSLVYDTPH